MARVFELRLEILGLKPAAWRRLRVPGSVRLDDVHQAIQIVMGWSDYHLHAFLVAGREYGPRPDEDFEDQPDWAGEDRSLTMADALTMGGGSLEYHYEDSRVELQSIAETRVERAVAIECLAGEGVAPSDGSPVLPFSVDSANQQLRNAMRPKATPAFPAGPHASAADQLLANLTLLVLFLGSRETRHGQREAAKTIRNEILERLQEAGLILTDPQRKSVVFTELGEEHAAALRDRMKMVTHQ